MWNMLLWWAFTLVVGELLRPKPNIENARASGLGDFRFPTAAEGREIPVAWGRGRIKGANLIWYGDFSTEAMTEKVKTGMFSSKKVTVGYRYYVSMQFALCHAQLGAITRIGFDEKEAWSGSAMNTTVTINQPNLFGGEKKEGGIVGSATIYSGAPAQAVDAYLATHQADCPAYRGVSTVILKGTGRGCYVGTSHYIKAPFFDYQRFPNLLGNGFHNVSGDANPAECLYELLTNTAWGAGIPTADIDLASFQAAASTLHAEGNGFSYLWDRRTTVNAMAEEILRQIDGLIFVHQSTGKFTLKLARADYNTATLPVLDDGNIVRLDEYTRGGWDETVNELTASYIDAADNYVDKAASGNDLGNWRIQGAAVASRINLPGVRTAALAKQILARELKQMSYPFARIRITCNREAAGLLPGGVFKWNWPELGIADMVMRVQRIGHGGLNGGQVQIDAAQDVFGTADVVFSGPSPSGWTPILNAAAAAPQRKVIEAPYWANLAEELPDPTVGKLLVMAVRPSPDALSYAVHEAILPEAYRLGADAADFAPWGTLQASLAINTNAVHAAGFTVLPGVDLARIQSDTPAGIALGNNLALIDNEIVAFEGATLNVDGSLTVTNVWRGLFDTVPAAHAAGAAVWFISYGSATTDRGYSSGNTVSVKCLPRTSLGELAIASAPADAVTMAGRAGRPYRPGKFTINGVRYPASVATTVLTFAWEHRDRLTQALAVTKDDAAGVGPEAGVTYNVRVYDDADLLLHSGNTAANTYGYTATATVALLHFEGAHGSTTYTDDAGNTWTRFGNAIISTTQFNVGAASGYFDGSGDYITTPHKGAFDAQGDFTVEMWVRPAAIGSNKVLIKKGASATNSGWRLSMGSTGVLYFSFMDGTGEQNTSAGAGNELAANVWEHVAVVKEGDDVRIYQGGILKNTTTLTRPVVTNTAALYIGRDASNSARDWNGYIDEVRVSTVARYTADFTPPAAPFTLADGALPAGLRVEVEADRGGVLSSQAINHAFALSV